MSHRLRLSGPRTFGLAAVGLALALDQAHKFWMLHVFDIGLRQPIHLTSFLDLVLSWNFGVSYSLLSSQSQPARALLVAFQLSIAGCLAYWLWRAPRRLTAAGLGLVVGGALGNVADRLTRGAVADFFFFHTALPVGPLANYVFNVADAAIFLGVVLLLLESFRANSPRPSPAAG
ncbi:signal peptidase II [Methylosinus sp. Ce-a6]|uniref:signal peptidase II n=1 Tax=Methylosinus sp. Ce-a6 TaxID=2172005 RepID=UPI001FCF24A5|nr:signal peptidase II [Methylosinus sp. Ce-a6]